MEAFKEFILAAAPWIAIGIMLLTVILVTSATKSAKQTTDENNKAENPKKKGISMWFVAGLLDFAVAAGLLASGDYVSLATWVGLGLVFCVFGVWDYLINKK